MAKSVLLITDDPQRSAFLEEALAEWFDIDRIHLSDAAERTGLEADLIAVDVDLSSVSVANMVRTAIRAASRIKDRVFTVRANNPADAMRASALGASALLGRPVAPREVKQYASRFVDTEKSAGAADPEKMAKRLSQIQDAICESVASHQPLPKEGVIGCCDQLIASLASNSIGNWLEAVRQHHSYTYRHCMTVSGLAVAFGLHLGMRYADVQRLSVAAMLHDIGKVRIPLEILDKPGELTAEERKLINLHPGYGSQILSVDRQFDDEVADIARHHHEYLDGTGYPDGLRGDQIKDMVRIMTIVDIFSALIDRRAYKEPMPPEEALAIMRAMEGKLEMCILEAFEPVAMMARFHGHDLAARRLAG